MTNRKIYDKQKIVSQTKQTICQTESSMPNRKPYAKQNKLYAKEKSVWQTEITVCQR